jgi:hypothetical protein
MKDNTMDKAGSTAILSPPGSIGDSRDSHLGRDEVCFDKLLLGKFAHWIGMLDSMDVKTIGDDRARR